MINHNMAARRGGAQQVASWFFRSPPTADMRVRLFCFPCAGYGAAMYRSWQSQAPSWLEIVPVQPPGRANRLAEAPLDSFPELVRSILPEFSTLVDRPYAFFGHSMGAVFASELAAEIVRQGMPAPMQLFLSARQPPNLPSPVGPLSHLDDAAFVEEVNKRYGGIPREIIEAPEVLEMLLPTLKADIRALEKIERSAPQKLPISISALGGTDDILVPEYLLAGWESWTERDFDLHLFDGGHFYLEDQRSALILHIKHVLEVKSRAAGTANSS
jgi:medium-chain acyl-[acyl-carrier-protein] hydrolase